MNSGDDRTRTGGLSPDKRALCAAELRPRGARVCAGGIRTHGLELMRLARTAAPLPRCAAKGLAGRSRTCGLRFPKPAGWPTPLQPDDDQRVPPAGLEPAASGLRARRHRHFDHGGMNKLRRQGLEPALSRVTAARLTDSTTPERERRQQDSNLRTARAAYAVATRCLRLTRPCLQERKERESNPQGPKAHPFSRRDTAPVAVLPRVAPAGVEPATPG